MDTPVVTNAGPLIALAKLNLLHLLKHLYGRVYIPHAVYEETVVEGLRRGLPDAQTLRLFLTQENWEPVAVEEPPEIAALHLDRGERESLALALSQQAMLLIDEERGRAAARGYSLKVRGTLGVLVEAYRRSFLTADQLRFHFSQIQERDDIWISPSLCRRVLGEVLGGE